MWIRSQDKRKLIKCQEFSIDYLNGQFNDEQLRMLGTQKGWGIKTKYAVVLGFYSSQEKAIKVLDMIQKRIYENYSDRQVPYTEQNYRAYYVFQMPQDEEVNKDE